MISLKTHIWLALVLGVAFLIALILSYFVVIDIAQATGSINLQPAIVRIGFINFGCYIFYILFVLIRALKQTNPLAS